MGSHYFVSQRDMLARFAVHLMSFFRPIGGKEVPIYSKESRRRNKARGRAVLNYAAIRSHQMLTWSFRAVVLPVIPAQQGSVR
jgi:hypothetical protein